MYGPDLVVGPQAANVDLANTYLDRVAGGAWRPDRNMEVTILDGDNSNQDQAYLTHVPEPGSVLLLVAGLTALVLVRRGGARFSRTS